ncbi:Lacal_2735 family protein [Tamlana sp. I1]|uniref:Lacal_2735 family protein n=1 Tax=Tamlana sp. I1 TaxID=2762061 RepID=UPI00188E46A6|nr:Lacal_2735 family protein [Tamlana sp. I1]
MNASILTQCNKLLDRYKQLIEQAYNFSQIDAALSDILEFKAIKILNEVNKLKYLTTNQVRFASI